MHSGLLAPRIAISSAIEAGAQNANLDKVPESYVRTPYCEIWQTCYIESHTLRASTRWIHRR